jgi:glutamate/aspartate transport system substrate-binding protein
VKLFAAALIAVSTALSLPTKAQELSGTLQKIRDTKTIALGVQETSIPFSYLDGNQQAVGYSVDLCLGIADAIKKKLGLATLEIQRVPVSSATRIPLTANGTVDLQCGSTTNNAERRKQVAFSYPYYFAAVKIMVPRESAIKSIQDLKGKSVVTTSGGTTIHVIKALSDKHDLGLRLPTSKDHAEGFLMMETGRSDAVSNDDVLLYGLRANAKTPGDFSVLPDPLSSEPYGLMFRRDDAAFKDVVNSALAAMYKSGQALSLYKKWFEQPIPPKGLNLQLPMSDQLAATFAQPREIQD